MIKYPKTPRLDKADTSEWGKLNAVISEKLDGANAAVSFNSPKRIVLQSRGHILTGGWKETQFDLFKGLCNDLWRSLEETLGTRYVLFGEWMYAKHRVYYDALPGYFMTYDIYDKENDFYISTPKRKDILSNISGIHEIPIIHQEKFNKINNFEQFIGCTPYKTKDWKNNLIASASKLGIKDPMKNTDDSDLMEGVYIKVEDDDKVVGRVKVPRAEFEKVRSDDELWKRQIIIPNKRTK